jgi:subtilisin family serine protease
MSHRSGRGLTRSLVGALATVAVVATGMAAAGQAQASPPTKPEATPASKIKPELMSKLSGKEAKSATDFWVRLAPKADLTAASRITDWTERGTAVANALRKTAADSQGTVRAELDAQHVKYQAFWGTNAIRVEGGSLALAQNLASHTEVEGLYAPLQIEVPKVTPGQQEKEVQAVEWGVANIKANQVWSQYGDRGEGIVVASIDTGVQYDHPALVNQYRGNLGNGTFDHNYNWFDAAGTSPNAPSDGNGHGTHTMGTMVGERVLPVRRGADRFRSVDAPADQPGRPGTRREQAAERHQQLVGLTAAVERPVHGGHHHGLDGVRDLRCVRQRQQR